jgi:hypothetical protein
MLYHGCVASLEQHVLVELLIFDSPICGLAADRGASRRREDENLEKFAGLPMDIFFRKISE